jgi:hypothetical protein
MNVRTGDRYRSQVCTTEIVVVRGADAEVDLTCGGQPLVPIDEQPPAGAVPAPGLAAGTLVGKRYVGSDDGIELLVTKAGEGTLAIGETPLEIAAARKLPTSD